MPRNSVTLALVAHLRIASFQTLKQLVSQMASANSNCSLLRKFKKIPVYVVEEHNDALEFIYSAIGRQRLPLEGTTLLHLDAHPDLLIDRKLKGEEARSGRKLLPLLQIENWIVPAAAAGHLGRVVWLRPPWAKQFTDGTRTINVGDHPETGLLRVDSKEPYYLSDALFASRLEKPRQFSLVVAELCDSNAKSSNAKSKDIKQNFINNLVNSLNISQPYVLDIDLDFFSTGNPFLSLYENINLYDRLQPIFDFKPPENDNTETIQNFVNTREKQLDELESLFQHLETHGSLRNFSGEKSELFYKVSELAEIVLREADSTGDKPDWWAVFAAGCTRDQGGLPYHISTEEEIQSLVDNALTPLLRSLPPPVLVTVARSTDDGYCPSHQVDLIQSLVLRVLQDVYDTDEAQLNYLNVKTL